MKRNIFFILFSLILSVGCVATSFANVLTIFVPQRSSCPLADPDNKSSFCASFKYVAGCHCSARLPSGMCTDMNTIYNRMIGMFGSQLKACQYQKDTTVQACMDDWNCYRLGGHDSLGNLCNGTGRACA